MEAAKRQRSSRKAGLGGGRFCPISVRRSRKASVESWGYGESSRSGKRSRISKTGRRSREARSGGGGTGYGGETGGSRKTGGRSGEAGSGGAVQLEEAARQAWAAAAQARAAEAAKLAEAEKQAKAAKQAEDARQAEEAARQAREADAQARAQEERTRRQEEYILKVAYADYTIVKRCHDKREWGYISEPQLAEVQAALSDHREKDQKTNIDLDALQKQANTLADDLFFRAEAWEGHPTNQLRNYAMRLSRN